MTVRSIPWVASIVAVLLVILSNAFLFVVTFPGVVRANEATSTTKQHLPLRRDAERPPAPPPFTKNLSATSVYLSDESIFPRLLYTKRADEVLPLASLTKLMTALVVLESDPDWQKTVIIEQEDMRGGARTPLSAGATVTIQDLWTMALVASDNSAAATLARVTAETEATFTTRMNGRAAALGLTHTTFSEPTGLSPANTGSARDVAALARAAFSEERISGAFTKLSADVSVSGTRTHIVSSDQKLRAHSPRADGWTFLAGKTGFVDESGYNGVLLGKTNENKSVLMVLLGSSTLETRQMEASALLSWSADILRPFVVARPRT